MFLARVVVLVKNCTSNYFELLVQKNGGKNAIKKSKEKNDRKKVFSSLKFFVKSFRHDFFSKKFLLVFFNSLLRSIQKQHKRKLVKIIKTKKVPTYLHLVAICQIYVAFKLYFFSAPRPYHHPMACVNFLALHPPKRIPLRGERHLFTYALATEKPMVLSGTAGSWQLAVWELAEDGPS
jgi:hypothetical protein